MLRLLDQMSAWDEVRLRCYRLIHGLRAMFA